MGATINYWEDRISEKELEEICSKEVIDFIELFRLLSLDDKVKVKRLISQENVF